MSVKINLDLAYSQSEDVVAREIEGEMIIVPLVSGIGDMEDALYTLNETGRVIWKRLNGKKSVNEVIRELSSEFEAEMGEIEKDVTGLLTELLKRKMLVEIKNV